MSEQSPDYKTDNSGTLQITLQISENVVELKIDMRQPRRIPIIGILASGERVRRWLIINRHGKLQLQ